LYNVLTTCEFSICY